MRFAVLRADEDTVHLLHVLRESGPHEIVAAYDSSDQRSGLKALVPQAVINEDWESLLSASSVDAVVVGRGGTGPRDVQLRQLVQAAVPLVLLHPACEAILGFELEMIQRDTGCPMVPYYPAAFHPAVDMLRQWVANCEECPVGEPEQLVMERATSDRSRDQVRRCLCQDTLVLRMIVGDVSQVGAMGHIDSSQSLSNLSAHFTNAAGLMARWSVGPVQQTEGSNLRLIGTRGDALLRMPSGGPWSLDITDHGTGRREYPAHAEDRAACERTVAVLRGTSLAPTWEDACRAIDLAELAEESARRGRTMSVHNETLTEEDTFKSIMAAGGCAMLVLAAAILMLVALVEGLELPLRNLGLWKLWPLALLLPLALFLLLQFLRLVFPQRREA